MPIIGNNTWTDAAAYGEGLGNSLAQAMLQLPQQRAQLQMQGVQYGLENKRLNQARDFKNMLLQLQQEKLAERQQYGNSLIDLKTQALQNQQQLGQERMQYLTDRQAWQQGLPIRGSEGSWMMPNEPVNPNFGSNAMLGMPDQGSSGGYSLYQPPMQSRPTQPMDANQYYQNLGRANMDMARFQGTNQVMTPANPQFPNYLTASNTINQLQKQYPQYSGQAAQPQQQYQVGTRAQQNGMTYEFDGTNWNPVQ